METVHFLLKNPHQANFPPFICPRSTPELLKITELVQTRMLKPPQLLRDTLT